MVMKLSLNFKKNDERPEVLVLWKNLKKAKPKLERLLVTESGHWSYEDGVYRFYHQSFKVFYLQARTLEIVEALKQLAPPEGEESRFKFYLKKGALPSEFPILHPWFMKIVQDGTGKEFDLKDNENWLPVTRPIVEAFLHAKYFLEMAVRYAKDLKRPPAMLPSGWASVLYLYGLR